MTNLVSFHLNSSVYNPNDYRTTLLGTSDCNSFTPFYSLFAHSLYIFNDNTKVIEYCLPTEPSGIQQERQYSGLFEALKVASRPTLYLYKIRGVEKTVNLHRGLIYKGDTIYMSLGIDTNYVLNTPMSEIIANPDITKFTLFIDNEFELEDDLKNIRKRVVKDYIDPLRNQGVDVVYTSRIKSWLFKNNYVAPKFKSVTRLMKHLKEEVPNFLIQ